MTELLKLLTECTALTAADRETLRSVAATMEYTADLLGADVFLDCPAKTGGMLVVAQAGPTSALSIYERRVTGEYALPENEPAVVRAFSSGLPARDTRAVTQENKTVRQDAVPVKNDAGEVIGILICERDISRSVQRDQKLEALKKSNEALLSRQEYGEPPERTRGADLLALREMHHRVKNSLQMASSMMNLQARRSGDEKVRAALKENVGRLLSISAIHDILSQSEGDKTVNLMELVQKITANFVSFALSGEGGVSIRVEGDAIPVSAGTAHDAALVLNELLTNAVEHAFPQGTGVVLVRLSQGLTYATVSVEDNGVGFDPTGVSSSSLGFQIVASTIEDKLRGKLQIASGAEGTRVSFDFPTK